MPAPSVVVHQGCYGQGTQDQYEQAETLSKRTLAIKEKALGLDHPKVALSLGNIALLYRTAGQEKYAKELEERATVIRSVKR